MGETLETTLLEKLTNLNNEEELNREKSLNMIKASDEFQLHIDSIEKSMDLLHYFVMNSTEENEQTIRLLGIRLFNASASSLKLLLAGYYQTAASQIRDITETYFLLDLFCKIPSHIETWRTCTEDDLRKQYSPAQVRKHLDSHDQFTGKKRERKYKFLSNVAAHPTPLSFRMLEPTPGEGVCCGPFFAEHALRALLEELAQAMLLAGATFSSFFQGHQETCYLTQLALAEAQENWAEKMLGRKAKGPSIKELRKNIADAFHTTSSE